jgi:hypothetical protein
MNYVLMVSLILNLFLLALAEKWWKEALYWMNREDSGPVWAHWIDTTTWTCGGCGHDNRYDYSACSSCQRQRLNQYGE